jgi:hypothetical protein
MSEKAVFKTDARTVILSSPFRTRVDRIVVELCALIRKELVKIADKKS